MSIAEDNDVKYHTETKELDVKSITKNDWNPNFVTTQMMQAIKDDIQKHGFIGSIVVQKEHSSGMKNVIINGEHRFDALTQLGATKIPSIVLDVDDKTAMLLTLRLNREHGELMPDRVHELLTQLDNSGDASYLAALSAIPEEEIRMIMNLEIAKEQPVRQLLQQEQQLNPQPIPRQEQRPNTIKLSWNEINIAINNILQTIKNRSLSFDGVIGITKGGVIPATLIAEKLNLDVYLWHFKAKELQYDYADTLNLLHKPLIVDDILDSGATFQSVSDRMGILETKKEWYYATVSIKKAQLPISNQVIYSAIIPDSKWVIFPWEEF